MLLQYYGGRIRITRYYDFWVCIHRNNSVLSPVKHNLFHTASLRLVGQTQVTQPSLGGKTRKIVVRNPLSSK
jgi:hypothetical protein